MTDAEDRVSTALDIYLRTQLAAAADTYAFDGDMEAKLRVVLAASHADNAAEGEDAEG
jgi:hypothetical protein